MKILTCNIRYYGAADGDDRWECRQSLCIEVIRSRAPDIVCFQEVSSEQFADLQAAFPTFATFGMIDEPMNRNPVNAILYHRESFALVSQGGYWLSESPHVAGSSSWDSACVRLANWLRLEDRGSGREFRVINTHLDHISQPAREGQAGLINQDAAAYPDEYPQFLTGDMNCDAANPAIALFETGGWQDTYAAVHGTADPGFTYHGFKGPACESDLGKIDWIFARGQVKIAAAEIIADERAGRFPSDHYFIAAEVEL